MARDNPVFGTGPGHLRQRCTSFIATPVPVTSGRRIYSHNDWLQTLITFGLVGAVPILLTGLLVFSHWFWSGGIHGNRMVGVCGFHWQDALHAYFDFPFQVHSVLTLFLVLCAGARPRRSRQRSAS